MAQYVLVLLLSLVTSSLANPIITYIWLSEDPLPKNYRQKLVSLDYPYQLILNCDMAIDKVQQLLDRRFISKSIAHNQLAEICRYSHMYINGGTYSDLDVDLDYKCYQEAIVGQNNAWPTDPTTEVIDNYFFYEQKLSKNLFWFLKHFDLHLSLGRNKSLFSKESLSDFNLGTVNKCLKTIPSGSLLKKFDTQKQNKMSISSQLIYWMITWLIILVIAVLFYRILIKNHKIHPGTLNTQRQVTLSQESPERESCNTSREMI